MEKLEKKIGHTFKNKELLELALTHSSYSNERGKGRLGCYERLEFLGDSILGYFTAEHLFRTYPDKPEGEMTKIRAELVCEQSLARVAEKLGLGEQLRLGHGEDMNGGRTRPSITADAVEAVLAAIYMDAGIEAARKFVYAHILTEAAQAARAGSHDYKTMFQELVQHDGGESPVYRMAGESGPDHNKTFIAEVLVYGKVMGRGSGRSKKESEQNAARDAMERLKAEVMQ